MIADCETCERKQVPCESCQESQRAICYRCVGDVDDPYGELDTATLFPEKKNRAELKTAYDLVVAESDKILKFTGPPLGCTCHPDDTPPRPCPQKFALTECREDGNEDLIERLTEYNKDWRTRAGSAKEVAEAIAEIKRLRALADLTKDRTRK